MKERGWLLLILAFYVLLGLGYSLAMPVWEAPDEIAHYRYALLLARQGRLPTQEENYEAFQPPGYYLLAGGALALLEGARPGAAALYAPPQIPENVTRPLPIFRWDRENFDVGQLWGPLLLRWLGVAAGAVALLFIFRGGRLLFPGRPVIGLAATALAAGTPQFVHVTASVSNDVLAIVAGAFLFWLLARLAGRRATPAEPSVLLLAGAAGAAVLLPLLVKLTVLPAGIGVLAAVAYHSRAHLRRRGRRGRLLLLAVLVATAGLLAVILLATGPGRNLLSEFRWRLLHLRPGFWEPLVIARRTAHTYWGYVGWVAVPLPRPWLWSAVTLAGIGAAASLPRLIRGAPGAQRGWRLLWFTVLVAVAAFLRNAFTTTAFQGRFFFPIIGPLSLLAAGGWAVLLPERVRKLLLPAVLLLVLALNLALWGTGILPVYYQPWLD